MLDGPFKIMLGTVNLGPGLEYICTNVKEICGLQTNLSNAFRRKIVIGKL